MRQAHGVLRTLSLPLSLVLVLTGLTPAARAADEGINAQRFQPHFGRGDIWGVTSSRIDPGYSWLVGLDLNYAYKPLLLIGTDGSVRREVVADLLMADLGVSLGFLEWAEVSLAVPAALSMCGEGLASTGRPTSGGLGDLRGSLKVNLLGKGAFPVGLGLAATLTAPTATDGYLGNGTMTVSPRLVADVRVDRLLLAANVEYTWRGEAVELANTSLDPELGIGVGGQYWLSPEKLAIVGETQALTSAKQLFSNSAKNAMEFLVGVRMRPWALTDTRGPLDGLRIDLAGGPGVTEGVGTPLWRALLGVAYAPIELGPPDSDRDGIADEADKCPRDPEDPDAFEDDDGCPDPDNDRDGVVDDADRCPLVPEDADEVADDDGCPDGDNDNDGLSDALDGAPLDPEDRDGFRDDDGVPDLDNDHDGVLDTADACPLAPEDRDGFDDKDGCPDLDNDGDGRSDAQDACPTEAEDNDGFRDRDGCPDPDNDGDSIPDGRDGCALIAEDVDGFSDSDGCPEPGKPVTRAVIAGRSIKIMEKVQFATGSDKILLDQSGALLAEVTKILKENAWIKLVEVQGHTDDVGKDAYNLDLSQRRAQSVVNHLISQGVEKERLQAKGYGETLPLGSNKTSRGRAMNRRVEFHILDGSPPTVVIEHNQDLIINDAATDAARPR